MTMQMKKLSAAIAAATLGTAMSMSAQAVPDATGDVTFTGSVPPACYMDPNNSGLTLSYELTTDPTTGQTSAMDKSASLTFDCNSPTVAVDITVTDTSPDGADLTTVVTNNVATAAATETATISDAGTDAITPATTDSNYDITLGIDSSYAPESGIDDLQSGSYTSNVSITVTAS